MISCICPACGKVFRAKEGAVGKKAKCRQCGHFFVVTAGPHIQNSQGVEVKPTSIPDGSTAQAKSDAPVEGHQADASLAELTSQRTRKLVLAAAAITIAVLILSALFLKTALKSTPASTAEAGALAPAPIDRRDDRGVGVAQSDTPASQARPGDAGAATQASGSQEQPTKSPSNPPTAASGNDARATGQEDAAVDPIALKFPPRSGNLTLIDFRKAMDSKGLSYVRASQFPLSFPTSIREFVSSLSDSEREQTYVLRDLDAAAVQPESMLTYGMLRADTNGLLSTVSVPDEMEAYVHSVVPLRLCNSAYEHNHSEAEGEAKFSASFSLCKAAVRRSMPWFLTKEKTLSPCHDLTDILTVIRSHGYLYLPQSRDETVVFVVSAFDAPFKGELREHKIRLTMDVVFDQVRLERPVDVGLYKLIALLQARCNSDELDNWNLAGGLLNDDPDLFRPSDTVSQQTATAQLVAVFLYDDRHNVLAAYRLPNDKRVLELPPVEPAKEAPRTIATGAKGTAGGPKTGASETKPTAVWPSQPAKIAGKRAPRTRGGISKIKTAADREQLTQQFLSSIAGHWRLESKHGEVVSSETLRIDNQGNWLNVKDGHEDLAFVMQEINYDPASRTVRFVKNPAGSISKEKARHVEILKLDKSMLRAVQNGGAGRRNLVALGGEGLRRSGIRCRGCRVNEVAERVIPSAVGDV